MVVYRETVQKGWTKYIKSEQEVFVARSDYSEKDVVKGAGFWWNPQARVWYTKEPKTAAKLLPYCLPELQEELRALEEERQAALEASRSVSADFVVPSPEGLSYLPYQLAGIKYISQRPSTLLGDEPGLGKTIQVCGIINLDKSIKTVLVVCPASLKINWARELDKWSTRPLVAAVASGKPSPAVLDCFSGLSLFNNEVGPNGYEGVQDVQGSAYSPHVLGSSPFDCSTAVSRSATIESPIFQKEINDRFVNAGNSNLGGSFGNGNPPVAVDKSRHVGKSGGTLRGSKRGLVAPKKPQSVARDSEVVIPQGASPDAKHLGNLRYAQSLFEKLKVFSELRVTYSCGSGHGGSPVFVLIINYDILISWRNVSESGVWSILCVDEAHYLKNSKAKRTQLVVGSTKRSNFHFPGIRASRRLYLTGTPIVNRPLELWTLASSLKADLFSNFFAYAKRYCNAHQNRYGWDFSEASNLTELQDKLRESILCRRLKKDVLKELPAKRRTVIELSADGEGARAVRAEIEASKRNEARLEELKANVELAKASDNESEYKDAVRLLRHAATAAFTEIARLRHDTAVQKIPQCIDFIKEQLESIDKVVVFAHHHDVVKGLKQAFGDSAVVLTGQTAQADRQDAVDRFQRDPAVKVFIGSITAAGVGLTLTAASTVIFTELDWVPGNVTQAEDRCHRIGQKDSVNIYHLVLEESLDCTIAKTIVNKQAVIDRALDEVVEPEPVTPGAQPTTNNLTRKQITLEAVGLTKADVEAIHEGLKYISGFDSDHASFRNDVGYNGCDTRIGNSLAHQLSLTPKQAVVGKKILKKYRRQLGQELYTRIYG